MNLHDLLQYGPIAVQCHNVPDADALAAGFALHRYFSAAGKDPLLFYAGPPVTKPNLLLMIEALGIPVRHLPGMTAWDGLLVTVDCQYGAGNVSRVDAPCVAVIDHHIQEQELPPLSELRPWLGSCATLVWDMLRRESFVPDEALSTALHYGLFTDTNGFAEVRHPTDRDMWDALHVNTAILNRLKLSNLSRNDLHTVSQALSNFSANGEYRYALIPVPPCDPNILGFVSDLAMQVDTVDMVVAYSLLPNGDVKFSVRTSVREAKASELAAWLASGMGSGGGHREKAGGYLARQKYGECRGSMPEREYFDTRIREYLTAFTVLDCNDPQSLRGLPEPEGMGAFRKLPVRQAFVPCADLFSARREVQLRMLEGDIDVTVDVGDTLMIGISGEVYPIRQDVFARNYRPLAEAPGLDLAYAPAALEKASGRRIELLRHARACVSTGTDAVRAMRLDRRVKIFTLWDQTNYVSGGPGDWLVVRAPGDIYIVTAAIFEKIYARDMTGVDLACLPEARPAVKRPVPVRVSFAATEGILQTREGPVAHAAGDALITGTEGECWPVSRQRFEQTYAQSGEEGMYVSLPGKARALLLGEPAAVALPGGKGVLVGSPGDWLVQYADGEYGIVGGEIFARTYHLPE